MFGSCGCMWQNQERLDKTVLMVLNYNHPSSSFVAVSSIRSTILIFVLIRSTWLKHQCFYFNALCSGIVLCTRRNWRCWGDGCRAVHSRGARLNVTIKGQAKCIRQLLKLKHYFSRLRKFPGTLYWTLEHQWPCLCVLSRKHFWNCNINRNVCSFRELLLTSSITMCTSNCLMLECNDGHNIPVYFTLYTSSFRKGKKYLLFTIVYSRNDQAFLQHVRHSIHMHAMLLIFVLI